jgi:hypothetical protein
VQSVGVFQRVCGGRTESASNVWPGADDLPYCRRASTVRGDARRGSELTADLWRAFRAAVFATDSPDAHRLAKQLGPSPVSLDD